MHSVLHAHKETQLSLLLSLILLLLVLNKCVTDPVKPVTVYLGDPLTSSIYGESGQPNISCKDPMFSQYICMNKTDFEILLQKK